MRAAPGVGGLAASLFVLALLCGGRAEAACVAGTWTAPSTGLSPVRAETSHFALRWKGDVVSSAQLSAGRANLETAFATLNGRIGFPEPDCASATKRKVNVELDPAFGLTGGLDAAGLPTMWINPGGLADPAGIAHEFTHALQGASGGMRDSPYVGWLWESHAEWMSFQLDRYHTRNVFCSELLAMMPHIYYGSTRDRYCNWQFWEFLKNKYGFGIVNDIWTKSPGPTDPARLTADPFSVLMTNRKWSVSRLNDEFGLWAMHNVNWDYVDPIAGDLGRLFRTSYGSIDKRDDRWALRTTRMDAIDPAKRRYAVPFYWAPQRWGYNIVPLVRDAGATSVKVDFRGIVQLAPAVSSFPDFENVPAEIPPPASDWRWGLVVVDQAGASRYSSLKRGAAGSLTMPLATGERVFLVVVGAPSEMHHIRWDQPYFSIYRYPWMAQFTGALPEGFQPGAPTPTPNGHWHPNGGGWVDASASVASTAYVGPRARVLGGTVTGTARILDHAVVSGGSVSGSAEVGAMSLVSGDLSVRDSAKLYTVFLGAGMFEPGTVIAGTAQVRGDAEVRGGPTFKKGVYYGYMDKGSATRATAGTDLTDPVPEVTAVPDYTWR